MYSKFLKAIVWIKSYEQKVPYAAKVYGEYSVRKNGSEYIINHNNSGYSVKSLLRKKDAELLCIKLEEYMTLTWDGDDSNPIYPEFREELRNLLY